MRKKHFTIKGLSTKEILITKINDKYVVDIIAHGTWYQKTFYDLKNCFEFIRSYAYGYFKH